MLQVIPENPANDDQTIFWSEAKQAKANHIVSFQVLVDGCVDFSDDNFAQVRRDVSVSMGS